MSDDIMELDGVKYELPQWLEIGTSFFIPALNLRKTVNAIGEHYKKAEFILTYAQWVEQGIWGVRFWREM